MQNTIILDDIKFQLEPLIEYLIEYCKYGYHKLKATLKTQNNEIFQEKIISSLREISKILWNNEEMFSNEIDCFCQIEHYIIYIISNNCKNKDFGHFECIIYLLSIFKMLIDAKLEYLKDSTNFNEYDNQLHRYPKELYDFRMYFNEHILIRNSKFDDDIKLLNETIRSG